MSRLIRRTAEEQYVYRWQSPWMVNVYSVIEGYDSEEEDTYEMDPRDLDYELGNMIDAIELDFNEDADFMSDLASDEIGVKCKLALNVDEKMITVTLTADAELTPEQEEKFTDWWEGQLSDGWGEGLEQRDLVDVSTETETMYVSEDATFEDYCEANGITIPDEEDEEEFNSVYEDYENERFDRVTKYYYYAKPWPKHFTLTKV